MKQTLIFDRQKHNILIALRIDESTAKQIAMNFLSRNKHIGSPSNTVLKGNSWVVSVNILSPKKQVKEVLVDAENGRILNHHQFE